MSERTVAVAALGDLHFDAGRRGTLSDLFEHVNRTADVLALTGDLTSHGHPDEVEAFLEESRALDVPVVTILGNHDHEGGEQERVRALLSEQGIKVLDGTSTVIEGVGFAGVKGFAGGFGPQALAPFGEDLMKAFVNEAVAETLKLERALREIQHVEQRVVLVHYAPIEATVQGEPERIFPFLGSSRLAQPIDMLGAEVVLHGHAHHGSYRGATPGGIPVFNVARHVLEAEGLKVHLQQMRAPERREGPGRAEPERHRAPSA
jgi:uncharacterized protein